jgi:acyl-coenzyme A thioesterase PaaI-like protein
MDIEAIQDTITGNHCVGCGPANPHGLRIKSFWCGELETLAAFQPEPHMAAAHPAVLNGGVIATLIDCHAVCTAISYTRRLAGPNADPDAVFATGSLTIRYRRPTPIDHPVLVHARIVGVADRKTVLECTVTSAGEVCAEATVVAVRVAEGWADQPQRVPPPLQVLGGWRRPTSDRQPLAATV